MKKRMVILISIFFLTQNISAQTYTGDQKHIDQILKNIANFSKSVVKGDAEALGLAYTEDGKIFPSNKGIISGREAVTAYWDFSGDSKITHHKISPEEIKIIDDEAYDYGYYEGTTLYPDGKEESWKGKYVIVWKKVDNDWKIYLDIWNRIAD